MHDVTVRLRPCSYLDKHVGYDCSSIYDVVHLYADHGRRFILKAECFKANLRRSATTRLYRADISLFLSLPLIYVSFIERTQAYPTISRLSFWSYRIYSMCQWSISVSFQAEEMGAMGSVDRLGPAELYCSYRGFSYSNSYTKCSCGAGEGRRVLTN